MDELALPPVGSIWYISGHHWKIIAHTEKEGEPAIRVKPAKKRKPTFTWIWRLCVHSATYSGLNE